MSRQRRTLRFGPELEEPTVRRIVRTGLALAGLLFLLGLVSVLPGVDRLLEGLSVSPGALVLAAATLLVVAAMLWTAPAVERAVEQLLDGPMGTVSNAAASAKLLVDFLAVVVAYRGLEPALEPTFEAFDVVGLYHLGFLAIGLAVLGAFARRLYHCLDPVSRLLTVHVLDAVGARDEPGVADPDPNR